MSFDIGFTSEPGAAIGDKSAVVEGLQAYLERFGYLASTEQQGAVGISRAPVPTAEPGQFDEATYAALRRFQSFYGLPVTGMFDEATAALMSRPRCGMPDLPHAGSVASFVAQGNKWDHTNLTWSFQNFTADLSQAQIRAALQQAFGLWSEVTPLTFTEAANADLVIRFVVGDHGDGSPFDGPSGILAHGFYPPPNGGAIAGDIHFDDAETWSVAIPVPAGGIDLVTVAAHEIGHTLG